MRSGLKLGLIGCGAIGRTLGKAVSNGSAGKVELLGICDKNEERLESLYNEIGQEIIKTLDPEVLIENKNINLIIEAASIKAVKEIGEKVLECNKNLMIMSVGALADQELLDALYERAKKNCLKIYLPSGALIGLDGVKAAAVENLFNVESVITKNPQSLVGAPYLVENSIDVCSLKEPKTIFVGNAKEAIKGFPDNVNVAVALSLSGVGLEKTRVTIIADPGANRTQHEIKAEGDFGQLHCITRNNLHPNNPKTSYLAALSAIRLLKKISEPIEIGT
jgi:aspartate dehydrogenase